MTNNKVTHSDFEKEAKNILSNLTFQTIALSPDDTTEQVETKALTALVHLHQQEMLKVIGEDEVFIDIPILGANGKVERVITGESFIPYMVARNNLRREMRTNLSNNKDK